MGLEILVATSKLDTRLGEARLERGGGQACGGEGGRPDLAACTIAEITERAPRVTGRVLAPARDGDIPPAAVSAACIADHDVVAAVGQELHGGSRRVRRGEDPHG